MNAKRLTVCDDSSLLGLVDAAAYASFVNPDWTYSTLVAHFRTAMAKHALLIWDAGDGGNDYVIEFRDKITATTGFREATGTIRATAGKLHLASYTALTMAAQFDDETIPSTSEADLWIAVPKGPLRVRVIQAYDPDDFATPAEGNPHFIIEIEPGEAPVWTDVAWDTTQE
jgi:hypothetical protein